ncbi:MAG: ATP-grasp domain-containing protein [Pirellula sp.]|jgi:tetrahydromethanopterin:alpha-L-glutamate ligase
MIKLGWLGAKEGWYFRDLQRAATLNHWPKPIELQPLGFGDLQVAYLGGASSSFLDRPCELQKSQPHPDQCDALIVRTMPLGSLEQTVFRMNALHVAQANGLRVVNPPRSLEIAIDKWLTLETVRQSGLAIPNTICCQTRDQAMQAWEVLGRRCVVKPIFGGEGRGIMLVTDSDMAWRVFSTLEQLRAVIYCQEFLEGPGYDLRLLVIGDALFCVQRSGNGDWRTNVARGGSAKAFEPTFEQMQIAFKATRAVGAWMAGVDLLSDASGRDVVLEVNAVPGWKATAKALEVDIARVLLEKLLFSPA